MSLRVALAELRAALQQRGADAFLLTVGDEGRPRAVHVSVGWEDDALVAQVGARSAANVAARPAVALLYASRGAGDYSLIVDGTASVTSSEAVKRIRITPLKAVLHRPAEAPDPNASCAADCVPLLAGSEPPGR